MELYTTSRLRAHARCARYHHLRYDLGLADAPGASAAFGTAGHAALECWYGALLADRDANALAEAVEAVEASSLDPFERARLRVLICGYDARWRDEMDSYDVIAVEQQFRYELDGYQIGGKVDAIVRRRVDGAVFVVEHKFTGASIGDGESYWDRLAIDTQVSIYVDGAEQLIGEPIAGVIYDVIGRPSQRPLLATPEDKRKYTQGKGCKVCGGKVGKAGTGVLRLAQGGVVSADHAITVITKACGTCLGTGWEDAPRLYADQRASDETPEEFELRIGDLVSESPESWFRRGVVVRLDDELPAMRRDLIDRVRLIEISKALRAAPRNPDACVAYGTMCPFFAACAGRASIDDEIRFPRCGAHPELSQTST